MRTIFSTIISSLGGNIKEGLLLLALLASTSIIYASNTAVDGIYYDFDSSTLTATVTYRGISYNEYSNEYTGSVTIPETVTYNGTTYNVTSIASSAFSTCSSLTSVTIPESVQTIGWYPFRDCSSLTSVVWNAKNCADCTDRYYPFYSIESQITSFTFGENVEYIPKSLCSGMSQLTSITIPNSVTSIGDYAFEGCSSLTSITIPNSVTSIGSSAFRGCSSLTSVIWNVKNYAYTVYFGSQVTSFTFGDNVEHIPAELCLGMSQLTSITIPNSVTSIGESAFEGCSSLTSITIPNSVTSIGKDAFYNTGIYNDESNWGDGVLYISNCLIDAKSDITGSYTIKDNTQLIADYAFYKCTYLTSVTIPESVTSIGSSAFSSCSKLTSVTIPNSVTSIGTAAFAYCSALTEPIYNEHFFVYMPSSYSGAYEIPEGIKQIAGAAFYYCSSLTSITIPNSVTSIGERAFLSCSKLTSITIPNSVTSIGERAFSSCSYLTSVTIGNSVTSIGSAAFRDCSKLTAVHITDIAAWCRVAFDASLSNPLFYAKNLYLNGELITSLVVPEGVTSIGDYAFEGCSSLTSVTIPNSVTSIGESTFEGCSSLTSVTIPNSVTSIGERAFYGCSALTSIELHNNIQNLRGAAFGYCTSLNSIVWNIKGSDMSERGGSTNGFPSLNNGMFIKMPQRRSASSSSTTDIFEGSRANITSVTIGDSVQYIPSSFCEDMEKLTSITIPDNVKTIGHSAFFGCSSLTSVTIPENITRIGHYAFANCDSLSSVIWNAKKCEDFYQNTIGNSTGGTPNYYPFYPEDVTSITFGENVEYIPAYLCCKMKNLTSVTISNSVTSIGEKAFYYCSSLTSVTIPNSVTSIGERAFYHCSSLTSVTIGNSVTSIGSEAFKECSSLTSVTIGNSVTSIGSSAFADCSALTSITIPNSVTSIGERAFYYCSSLTSITIPNSVTSIGEKAFYNCSKLTAVHITDIAAWCRVAFDGSFANPLFYAKNLYLNGELRNYLVVPEGVTSIGDYAFEGCSSLTGITIPESVTSIGGSTFYNCSALTSITVPKNVVVIGGSAFANCSSLNSVQWNAIDCYIKTDSQYTPSSPFSNSNVSSLVIGENVEVLPDAFCANVSSLDSITIGKNIKYIGKEAFRNCSTLVKTNYTGDVTGWCEINFYDCYSNPNYYAKNLYINGQEVKDVVVPNTVNKIQPYAFYGCPSLSSIVIPKSVKTIGENAFGECRKLYDVYCYPTTPPTAESNSFTNYNVYLHVLCDNLRDYQMDMVFGSFKYIECIESEDVTTNGVNITPGLNDVTITWPTENDADTYSIVIKQDGVVFCTLTFNAEGQLMNIAFAPARDGNHLAQYAEQAVNGYCFTVTGLEEATTYAYNITTTDASNQTLATYSGEFTTQSTTAVDNITTNNANIQKIIRDGQFIIVRDGKTYNAQGAAL